MDILFQSLLFKMK